MPTYKVDRPGKEPRIWTLYKNPVRESECPVSAITQKSFELVQLVDTLERTLKVTGSTLGADEMPGFLLDAIRICHQEEQAVEVAEREAEIRQ